ncbi:type II secretion system minor pseudopilin GspJ [Thermodesulfobacteriota bacterium]
MMRQNGFTLLELLVALAVSAVVSVIAYSGLRSMVDTRAAVEREMEDLTQLQQAFTLLARDIEQAVSRGIRNEYGEPQSAMVWRETESSPFEFTRNGWRNPAGRARSSLQRVAYEVKDEILYRQYWPILDRAQNSDPYGRKILRGVTDFQVVFLADNNEWQNFWPPDTTNNRLLLPRAVAVSLVVDGWGEIKRVFLVKS